jgi:NAD(P)-dependent dehydrogenase (short-subunit alcohol dehydrogenase family)
MQINLEGKVAIVTGVSGDGQVGQAVAKALAESGAQLAICARMIAIHPNLPELYRRKVVRLQRVLDDEATRPQAVEIIRSLIERIEIQPGKERGHCEVIIVGALAQILAFAQQKTTAASTGDSGTFLMVAGACNHRELTLPPIPV